MPDDPGHGVESGAPPLLALTQMGGPGPLRAEGGN
jgi:hypothetical protein